MTALESRSYMEFSPDKPPAARLISSDSVPDILSFRTSPSPWSKSWYQWGVPHWDGSSATKFCVRVPGEKPEIAQKQQKPAAKKLNSFNKLLSFRKL